MTIRAGEFVFTKQDSLSRLVFDISINVQSQEEIYYEDEENSQRDSRRSTYGRRFFILCGQGLGQRSC